MPYEQFLNRRNPGCVVIVADQSEATGSAGQPRAEMVASEVNRLLYDLVIQCSGGDGFRAMCSVGVIGYGGPPRSALGGVLADKSLVTIEELGTNPLRIEQRIRREDDGTGAIIERRSRLPVWVDPVARGPATMAGGLELARTAVVDFLGKYPDCFPPMVFHVTSSLPDRHAEQQAENMRRLKSSDGEVLLWNCYFPGTSHGRVEFPESETDLPDEAAKRLFRMSSVIPQPRERVVGATTRSRAFVIGGGLSSVIRCLPTGSEPLSRFFDSSRRAS